MRLKRLWIPVLWSVVILLLTLLPGNYFPKVQSFWDWLSPDKVVHVFIFGVQSFLLFYAQKQYSNTKSRFRITIVILGATIIFAAFTEIMQNTVLIKRDGNVYDFLADVVGVFAGLLAYNLLVEKKMANKKSY